MALEWKWSERIGSATLVQKRIDKNNNPMVNTFELSLYDGNAYLIMVYEYDNKYDMFSFWADKVHMNNCLGLVKGSSNLYEDEDSRITSFELNRTKCKHFKEIVQAISIAFDSIEIKIISG